MKRAFVITAAMALAVGACAAQQSAVDDGLIKAEQSLIAAHNGYQAAEAIAAPLIRHRALPADVVDKIAALNDRAEQLFSGADTSLSMAQRAAELEKLTLQLRALVK